MMMNRRSFLLLVLLILTVQSVSGIFNQAHPDMVRTERGSGPPKRSVTSASGGRKKMAVAAAVLGEDPSMVEIGYEDDIGFEPTTNFKFVSGFSILISALFLFFMVSNGLL